MAEEKPANQRLFCGKDAAKQYVWQIKDSEGANSTVPSHCEIKTTSRSLCIRYAFLIATKAAVQQTVFAGWLVPTLQYLSAAGWSLL